VPTLPPYYTTLWWSGTSYYYANETYYMSDAARNGYQVVAPPDRLKRLAQLEPQSPTERAVSFSRVPVTVSLLRNP
jgi:hypothetical protein